MELTRQNFLNLLFRSGEFTCFATLPKHNRVFCVDNSKIQEIAEFFCINPLLNIDLNPTEEYHNKNRGRRADCNVSAYRNILVELDTVPLDEQTKLINDLGMPYTTATYSGDKSIHFIISLSEDLPSKKEYDRVVARVFKALKGINDAATKNCSRISRFPGTTRLKTNKTQDLLELKNRVNLADLEAWCAQQIGPEDPTPPCTPNRKPLISSGFKSVGYSTANGINPFTRNFLSFGASKGEWNSALFRAACDMFRNGYTRQEVEAKVFAINKLLDQQDRGTIESAYKTVCK